MNENKVAFGLKNVHYALFDIKDGVVTFSTPIPLPGAVELTFDPRGDLIEFYADDMLYYAASNNQGYDGTLSIATIPEQFAVDALGEELDEEDGVLNELADAKGNHLHYYLNLMVMYEQRATLCLTVQQVVQHLHLKRKQIQRSQIQMSLNLYQALLILTENVWLKRRLQLNQNKRFMIIGTKKCIQKYLHYRKEHK